MLQRRARTLAAVAAMAAAAVACAPGPAIDTTADGSVPTPTSTTTEPPPSTLPPSPVPDEELPPEPLETFPVDPLDLPPLAPVAGRIAFHATDAGIRTGPTTVGLDTATFPSQPTWSRNGARLALAALPAPDTPVVQVFDGPSAELLATSPAARPYFFMSWSDDGTRIAALGPGVDDNDTPQTVLDILDAEGAMVNEAVVAAQELYLAWEPEGDRLAVHADDRLLSISAEAVTTDLGRVGADFTAPKWIPGTDEIVLVADIEGSPLVIRRGIDAAATLRSLGPAEQPLGITVHPSGEIAALSRTFDTESEPAAERIDFGEFAQATQSSGSVEIVDLATGDRVEIFDGATLWVEWNPQGTHLLLYEGDTAGGLGTWWVYEYRPGGEIEAAVPIASAAPTPIFLQTFLAFGDQFVESPRLWSPDGKEFVYAELSDVGSVVMTVGIDGAAIPAPVAAGEVGFWSPRG